MYCKLIELSRRLVRVLATDDLRLWLVVILSLSAVCNADAGDGHLPKCRQYELVRLIPAPACGTTAFWRITATNDAGDFVGAVTCFIEPRAIRGSIRGAVEFLELPTHIRSQLNDVRADGLAVGYVDLDGTQAFRGLVARPNEAIEVIAPPDGMYAVEFTAVNSAGLVVGRAQPDPLVSAFVPCFYDLDTRTFTLVDLGRFDDGAFLDVDDTGMAVGYTATLGARRDVWAIRGTIGGFELIADSFPGAWYFATAVNESAEVLVRSTTLGMPSSNHLLFDGLHVETLRTLVPSTDAIASNIDEQGWAHGVGEIPGDPSSAMLWRPDGKPFPMGTEDIIGGTALNAVGGDGRLAPNGRIVVQVGAMNAQGWPERMAAVLEPVSIRSEPSADFDCDGAVDFDDLLYLLARGGPCNGRHCYADLDHDGVVSLTDLMDLIAQWP